MYIKESRLKVQKVDSNIKINEDYVRICTHAHIYACMYVHVRTFTQYQNTQVVSLIYKSLYIQNWPIHFTRASGMKAIDIIFILRYQQVL